MSQRLPVKPGRSLGPAGSGRWIVVLAGWLWVAGCGGGGITGAVDAGRDTPDGGGGPNGLDAASADGVDVSDLVDLVDLVDLIDARDGGGPGDLGPSLDGDSDATPPAGRFVQMLTGLGQDPVFKGVWAGSPGHAVAVGNDGLVATWDQGAGWSLAPAGDGATLLNAVTGWAPDDLWAVGKGGAIAHGTTEGLGVVLPAGGLPTLWGAAAVGPSDVFAVGLAGTIVHNDGVGWQQLSGPGLEPAMWRGMEVTSEATVVVGRGGALGVRPAGGALSPVAVPTTADLLAVAAEDAGTF